MKHEARPVDDAALSAVERGRHGKWHGLIARLCRTIRSAWVALSVAQEEARRKEEELTQLASDDEAGREAVLCVIHHTGEVELFAEPSVRLKVVHFPRVKEELRGKAEEVVECELPIRYRRLYFPGKCRASGDVLLCMTPAERLNAMANMELVKVVSKWERKFNQQGAK